MEQMPSNTPVMESKPGPAGWVQTWITAVTKPNEQTFVDMTEQPNATSKTAFIWMFIAGTISAIFQTILQAIYSATGYTPQIPGLEKYMPTVGGDPTTMGISLITGLCLSPLGGLLAVLFFAIGVAIVQWIAKLFGGVGTFEKLAYAMAAISVPFTLVSSILALFSAIPFVGFCTGLLSFGLGIYGLVLQVMAVKGINRFGWGSAIGSVLIPGFVVFLLCFCAAFMLALLIAPMFGDVFTSMQQLVP
ncbi:MAG: YIP1 family protein [Anaerolineales bacterium]|nr:YIP1 family protein [Anaerolineales bacterium]